MRMDGVYARLDLQVSLKVYICLRRRHEEGLLSDRHVLLLWCAVLSRHELLRLLLEEVVGLD
jgi:hypothetical protein